MATIEFLNLWFAEFLVYKLDGSDPTPRIFGFLNQEGGMNLALFKY